jgi:hypothetical protein
VSSMRTLDESLAQVRDVDGWMSPDQAERLYRAAASTRPGDQIVEIGSGGAGSGDRPSRRKRSGAAGVVRIRG